MGKLFLMFIALALGTSAVRAQDAPPERLDVITAKHVVNLLSAAPNATNYCVAWFNNGFGRIDLPASKLPIPVELDKPYVWFRITNPTNGSKDDYWITEQTNWDTYLTGNNVALLRSNSLQFGTFQISSNYTIPVVNEPVTWETRTDTLTVGYTSTNTLIVVKKQGTNWEWSVRGANGADNWTSAATLDAAKAAARLVVP